MPRDIVTKLPKNYKNPPELEWRIPIFWICDCSQSMGLKIGSNNFVNIDEINKTILKIIEKFNKFPQRPFTMRTLRFSENAEWVDKESSVVEHYSWKNLSTGGVSDLGEAFNTIADALKPIDDGGTMPRRTFPTVLVLITDGYPTDDWESGLNKLMSTYWGERANRIAVALGEAANDEFILDILKQFIGNVWQREEKLIILSDEKDFDLFVEKFCSFFFL